MQILLCKSMQDENDLYVFIEFKIQFTAQPTIDRMFWTVNLLIPYSVKMMSLTQLKSACFFVVFVVPKHIQSDAVCPPIDKN